MGQAIATGAGEMYPIIKNISLGHGPNKNIDRDLKELAQNVLTRSCGLDYFGERMLPRTFVTPPAKANGLKKQDLFRKKKV